MSQIKAPLIVYIPDTRGVQISRYGSGNLKLGFGVFTYSRLPGHPSNPALGTNNPAAGWKGTCPGATEECQAICYASRPVMEAGPVAALWHTNRAADVPPIPTEAVLLRLHVSGDFDSVEYIENWIARLTERPDVVMWAYTRSWRVPELLPALERLRALPNVQLFASMDATCRDRAPLGWRRSWIWRDAPSDRGPMENRIHPLAVFKPGGGGAFSYSKDNFVASTEPGVRPPVAAYTCPEETGRKANCLECGYCFEGQKNDVVFLEH